MGNAQLEFPLFGLKKGLNGDKMNENNSKCQMKDYEEVSAQNEYNKALDELQTAKFLLVWYLGHYPALSKPVELAKWVLCPHLVGKDGYRVRRPEHVSVVVKLAKKCGLASFGKECVSAFENYCFALQTAQKTYNYTLNGAKREESDFGELEKLLELIKNEKDSE